MLPALTPTQTVSGSVVRRSASPLSRSQWHRYVASPPSTSKTSASRTQGTQRSSPMLGSAVSSRTPIDFQPRSFAPAMKRQAEAGVHQEWPHSAVGMHRALDSSIGLPTRSTSAWRMLVFATPPDVSRSFMFLPEVVDVGESVLGSVRGRDSQAGENSSAPASLTQSGIGIGSRGACDGDYPDRSPAR